jgi:hypothetical protein
VHTPPADSSEQQGGAVGAWPQAQFNQQQQQQGRRQQVQQKKPASNGQVGLVCFFALHANISHARDPSLHN